MTHAIRIHAHGGPEVLQWEAITVGDPGTNEVRLRHTAVGLNYIDTYHRSGAYPVALPAILGMEAAGVVEAVGSNVSDFRVGDRVAYASGPMGAYCEARIIPADRLVALPSGVSDITAAAAMLQGMTARFLLRQTFPVKHGDTILVQAAAGGVGLILCQWAKALGATVIGTVSTPEKAALATTAGADHIVYYTQEPLVERVRSITGGRGVDVVYDGVGAATFLPGLDCLRPRGMMVLFGAASGPVAPFDLQLLAAKGSLFVTRPTLFTHIGSRAELLESAADLFAVIAAGTVKIAVNQTFPLAAAADAHRALQGRHTTGSTVLLPGDAGAISAVGR
jgi:NADPH2:quinone reductase